jgi:tetratricopeptide (TPR) repeat protein
MSFFGLPHASDKVLDPKIDIRSFYQEGQQLMNEERWFTAEARFRQVLAVSPGHGLARAHRAICLFNMSREGEAVREAEKAVLSCPRESYTHFALGVVRHATGKLKQAEKSVSRALRMDPGNLCYQRRLDEIESQIQFVKKR